MSDPIDYVWEGSTPVYAARIERVTGALFTPIVQADVQSIDWTSRDIADPATVVDGGTLDKVDVIYDQMQPWPLDSSGCNFIHPIPGTAIPSGLTTYDVQYQITLTDGTVYLGRRLRTRQQHFD